MEEQTTRLAESSTTAAASYVETPSTRDAFDKFMVKCQNAAAAMETMCTEHMPVRFSQRVRQPNSRRILPHTHDESLVGTTVSVFWDVDCCWYVGTVKEFDRVAGWHIVRYDEYACRGSNPLDCSYPLLTNSASGPLCG